MIVRVIAANRSIELEDVRNFRAFAVHIEGTFENQTDRDEILGRAAVRHDHDYAWIAETWLREWPPLMNEAWWQDGLTNMISSVQRFGWVDVLSHSIRAHIKYT
jgi:hypothetical protein